MKLQFLGRALSWIRGRRNDLTRLFTNKSREEGQEDVGRMTNEPAFVLNYNIIPIKVVLNKARSCIVLLLILF